MATRKTFTLIGSVALLSGLATTVWAKQPDSPEVNKLLGNAKQQAAELQHDSDRMATFTRSNVTWHSYGTQLQAIREHINATGRVLADLNAAHGNGSV